MPCITLDSDFNIMILEEKAMGCCGSCGGEAPNHTNEQDKDKETDQQTTSQPQEQDKEKE